jgi:prolyl oligopeptidase
MRGKILGAVIVIVVGCGHPPTRDVQGPGPGSGRGTGTGTGTGAGEDPAGPPVAEKRPVVDRYFDVDVTDDYRWLEAEDADVDAWSDGQNAYARGLLDALPDVAALRDEVRAIVAAPITTYYGFEAAGGSLFGFRKSADKEQPELIVLDDPEHPEAARLILDPTAAGGSLETIDWFVPSPDGKKVAVSLSSAGSESGTLHVLGLDGSDVDMPIPNVQRGTGGGSVAWTPDSKGLYYTRYPAAGEKPDNELDFWMQVYFHRLGDAAEKDRHELGDDFPKVAEIFLASDARGRVIASVQKGDGGVFEHFLRDPKGGWRQLTQWSDQVIAVDFGPNDDLWLVSRKGAPRGKVLRLGAKKKLATAKVVIPEGKDAIITDYYDQWGALAAGDRLYVAYQTGGPSELRAFTLTGKAAKSPTLPPVSSVDKPLAWKGGVLVFATGYTTAGWYRFTAKTGALEPLPAISQLPPIDLSGYEVHRETATSKDGTAVPVNIVWPKGAAQDGSHPCVVNGYGGFAISESPFFLGATSVFLSRGVCFVDVNLRGGGEFGEAWHQAGMLTDKQNVFDDFAAALEYVVAQGYTSRERLAIMGGSNGGLLMGAMITQHPDLMKAVVSWVGIYDMLRNELSPNGQYNVSEYGSVTDEAQFRALYAYSPYHHVTAGTSYPAVLMLTGKNDPRVAPWHSRKFTAALQAAQAGDAPILLRTSDTAGHGMGTSTSERIEQIVARDAFILSQINR